MTDHATIVRIFRGRLKAGAEEELEEAERPAVIWLNTLDGCFGAQLCRVKEEPGTFAIISRWRDQAALDAMVNHPEYRERTAPGMGLLDGPPTVRHYLSA